MDEIKRDFVLKYTREIFMSLLAHEVIEWSKDKSEEEAYKLVAKAIGRFYDMQMAHAALPNGFGSSVSDTEVNNTVSVNESVDILS